MSPTGPSRSTEGPSTEPVRGYRRAGSLPRMVWPSRRHLCLSAWSGRDPSHMDDGGTFPGDDGAGTGSGLSRLRSESQAPPLSHPLSLPISLVWLLACPGFEPHRPVGKLDGRRRSSPTSCSRARFSVSLDPVQLLPSSGLQRSVGASGSRRNAGETSAGHRRLLASLQTLAGRYALGHRVLVEDGIGRSWFPARGRGRCRARASQPATG